MENMNFEIVPANLAIKAMMDSGYKNAAYALAELMDNSIQAKATLVELLCAEKTTFVDKRVRTRVDEIGILDNGHGMDVATLRIALQFGNGTRLNDPNPKGMGKFGMGLPSASISQAKRVEVWSWTDGVEHSNYSYLDVDEIMRGEMASIPMPLKREIPQKWSAIGESFSKTGTLVVWSGLDRCIWKTGRAIIQNSEFLIGRMYRKFLDLGNVKIRMATYDTDSKAYPKTLETFAKPNDPLYLMEGTSTPPPYDCKAMFEPWPSKENYIHIVPIRFAGEIHSVKIRTSIAPKEVRPDGAGHSAYGNHAAKNIGVSILRADRELELDRSWAKFGDVRERWWGLELEFPPALDELFGVTNNKQYARNFSEMASINVDDYLKEQGQTLQELKDELREDNDPKLPLLELAANIRKLISEMSGIISVQNKNVRNKEHRARHGLKPEREATEKTRQRQEEGHIGGSDAGESRPRSERETELKSAMIERGIDVEEAGEYTKIAIDNSLKYIFLESSLDSPAFFSVQPKGGTLMITLNTNHAAYDRLVDVLEKEFEGGEDDLKERLNNALDGLKLLLMAWARYEDEQQSSLAREKAQEARIDWGRMARRFLEREE